MAVHFHLTKTDSPRNPPPVDPYGPYEGAVTHTPQKNPPQGVGRKPQFKSGFD